MIVLMLGVESFVARSWVDFSDPVSLNWRLSAKDAVHLAPGKDVLCLGDSLVKHGLIPKVIESRTGLRVQNLAAARGAAPLTYFLFRRALEAGARPGAVVVDFKPGLLPQPPHFHLRYWQEFGTPRELLDLAMTNRGGSFVSPLILGRILPTVRSRLEIRSNLMAALRGERDQLYLMNRSLMHNWARNDGAHIAAKNPEFHGDLSPTHQKAFPANKWSIQKLNRTFINRFFALAAERGIKVYWVLPPLTPKLQERRENSESDLNYVQLARSIMNKYPNVTIVDARHSHYPHEVFIDPTHLDREGGLALSLDVAEVLRRDRSGTLNDSRWVNLPAYRPTPNDIPIEDVEETKLAITRAAIIK